MRSKLFLVTASLLGFFWLAGGCPGANNNPNGPQPVVLPTSLTLDISELPEDGDADAAKLINQSLPQRGRFDRVVRSSATIIHRFQRFADRALALAARVRQDMNDPNQTQVSGTLDVDDDHPVSYKADFAAFDFDGDGQPEGSGNAVDLPVVMRMWTDHGAGYVRFLCVKITTPATDANAGAGALYVKPKAGDPNSPVNVLMRIDWDRTNPQHKWNTALLSGAVHPLQTIAAGQARVDVRENEAGAIEKTVRAAYDFESNLYGIETLQAAVHWAVDGDTALLSAVYTGGEYPGSISNICLDMPERHMIVDGCNGFDVQDMTFLDIPTETVDFPADFPEQPTY